MSKMKKKAGGGGFGKNKKKSGQETSKMKPQQPTSRKDLRKEARKMKKQMKAEFFHRKSNKVSHLIISYVPCYVK